jgi:hypothetical protein
MRGWFGASYWSPGSRLALSVPHGGFEKFTPAFADSTAERDRTGEVVLPVFVQYADRACLPH